MLTFANLRIAFVSSSSKHCQARMLLWLLVPGLGLAAPPHIVTIVVDDLGWADVPWNNPESPAVNLGRYGDT